MNADEKWIITGLQSGSEVAYQHLFNSYYELLISYAAKFLKSTDSSREVVQKVFVRIYEKRESLEISSLKSYLLRSIYHGCMEELRGEQRQLDIVDFDHSENLDFLEQAEREAEIWKAIDQLPEKCHQIFVMNRFEGLKNQQIADNLGLSKRTVETQITLALRTLREKLLSWVFTF